MKKKCKDMHEVFTIQPQLMNQQDCYVTIDYNSPEEMKSDIMFLFNSVVPKNIDSAANIFCHNISDDKSCNIVKTGESILHDGLICDYSTIFRTMTYMKCDTSHVNEFTIDDIYHYTYVNNNYHDRITIVSTIPKVLKDSDGTKINFSTPDFEQLQQPWTHEPYVEYDKIKERHINKEFMLLSMHINDIAKKYSIELNAKNFILLPAKVKERFKQKYLHQLKSLEFSK
ncbi:MAG: hypothetical protein IJ542_00360 [Clostridia bacterium]|nr:hypothetical protein [Clostridia bacterium]